MCHRKHISELDNLAKQLWIVNRELNQVGDPVKARSALDSVIDRLEVNVQQLPQAHVAAVHATTQAHSLSLEAQHVLYDNLAEYVDPEVVASGLLIVARVRLQQACTDLERAQAWSVREGRERRA